MYTLLVTGDVPGASTYFNPLLQQTIIPCTSGTRPSSPTEGMFVYETDTDKLSFYNGTAWVQTYALDTQPLVFSTLTLIGTVASGFTSAGANGRAQLMLGAKLVSLGLFIPVSSTIASSSGNITDTLCFTITNSGLIPLYPVEAVFSNGATSGDALIDVDGTITLRTSSANVGSSTNIRISATYIIG
jgi:hypothetical protein